MKLFQEVRIEEHFRHARGENSIATRGAPVKLARVSLSCLEQVWCVVTKHVACIATSGMLAKFSFLVSTLQAQPSSVAVLAQAHDQTSRHHAAGETEGGAAPGAPGAAY